MRGRAQHLQRKSSTKERCWCYCYIQLGCLLNPAVGFQLVCLELVMAQVPAKGQSGVSRHTLQPVQEACYQQADSWSLSFTLAQRMGCRYSVQTPPQVTQTGGDALPDLRIQNCSLLTFTHTPPKVCGERPKAKVQKNAVILYLTHMALLRQCNSHTHIFFPSCTTLPGLPKTCTHSTGENHIYTVYTPQVYKKKLSNLP